tara:strand:- start:99 stop:494 length:396 start_codon:yes stop_codon:yes gene_type:complete
MSEGDWLDEEIEIMLDENAMKSWGSNDRQITRELIMDVDEETWRGAHLKAQKTVEGWTQLQTARQRLETRRVILEHIWDSTHARKRSKGQKATKRKKRSNKKKKPQKRKIKSKRKSKRKSNRRSRRKRVKR